MGEAMQKNVGTISLIVAIIALVSSLVPQIQDLCTSCAPQPLPPVANGPQGGPGMGPMGGAPGGRPMGGPGMMRRRELSAEVKALLNERVKLYDEALKTAQGNDLLKLRCKRDTAKLAVLRVEGGAFRIATGLSEALLANLAVKADPNASALDKNIAELDYQQQLDRFPGDKDAFNGTAEAFKNYPATPVTDDDLMNLLAAERASFNR